MQSRSSENSHVPNDEQSNNESILHMEGTSAET